MIRRIAYFQVFLDWPNSPVNSTELEAWIPANFLKLFLNFQIFYSLYNPVGYPLVLRGHYRIHSQGLNSIKLNILHFANAGLECITNDRLDRKGN